MEKFDYIKPIPINIWGWRFDSLLEFKYALSIRDDYEFLREHIPIYYDPTTKMPVQYMRTCTKRYTPNFLIRHKQTNEAKLVEIKPRQFANERQLLLRKRIAENFIRAKAYDWSFQIVFDDEIILTDAQQKVFERCCRSRRTLQLPGTYKAGYREDIFPLFFDRAPTNKKIEFVMFGNQKPYNLRMT